MSFTVDDLLKIIFIVGLTFSIVGISWQIMRVIGKLADTLQDTRKVVQNVSEVSDMALDDYKSVRGIVRNIGNIGASIDGIVNIMNKFPGRGSRTKPVPKRTSTEMMDE